MISFATVVALGFLLLFSIATDALFEGFMKELKEMFPAGAVVLVYVANMLVLFITTTIFFALIFKLLTAAHLRWKDVLTGALFTAVLFTLMQLGVSRYLVKTILGSSYGAAGSSIALLLWMYFSSIILYFGAEFTKFYAITFGPEIRPNAFAVMVQNVGRQSSARTLQENQEEIDQHRYE
jgi:membrane protein